MSLTLIFAIVLVFPVMTLFLVTVARVLRGRDGYDLGAMPFDEWIDYGDADEGDDGDDDEDEDER